ncbi:MAG: DUF4197 domain-containing protein [Allopontixanthobacter sediminis]
MNELIQLRPARRGFLVGLSATALLGVSACATTGGYSFTEAIRRLLMVSSERAFARMTADGGFWDQQVAQIGFSDLLGTRGDVLSSILSSSLFKSRLNDAFAGIAIEGSYRAAPVVADAVRVIGIGNAVALVRGGPTAATSFLQSEMSGQLIEVLVPEIGDALRVAQDPLVGQTLSALTGVNVAQVANSFGSRVNDVIWREIAQEESAIRADPRSTRDPLLIGVLGAGL